jgi:uncharacterized LabA/DUF88 family protein
MNSAYIDGQNLYMGTNSKPNPWNIDLIRFRKYLEKKYNVSRAYYFLGFVQETNQELYEKIQSAGFILIFRQHNSAMLGMKKGNVDTDIVFTIMKKMYRKENFEKIIFVSGDGDYKMLVDFLIEENRLHKVLFPNGKFASSLYKKLGAEFYDHLDTPDIKRKIQKK